MLASAWAWTVHLHSCTCTAQALPTAATLVPPYPAAPLPCCRYAERLVLTRPVTIQASPGDAVELTWQSSEPYQSTIEVDASVYPELADPAAVVLQGLRVRHSSPSIANNYAVRLVVSGGRVLGSAALSLPGAAEAAWRQHVMAA